MANGILIAGLLLIFIGSELAMRGGVGVARQFDVPPLFTGILVVATVTVLPEALVIFRAAMMSKPEIALGGLIGTNIINVLFVMGLGALLHPMASPPKVVFRDGGAMLLGCIALMICAATGAVSRYAGVLLLLAFAAYIVLVFATDWRRAPDHSVPLARALFRSEGDMPSMTGSVCLFVLGLITLALGAHLAVLGSIHFAAQWGWAETTVGLTILAAALSLPKLAVTLGAAVRGQTSIAVGQLLGAGVFSLFGVLGLTAIVAPLAFPAALADNDVYFLAVASVVILPLLAMRWRLSRPRGILLIIAYGCYLAYLLWRQGLPLPWGH
jgi:cation:H+ antiporter